MNNAFPYSSQEKKFARATIFNGRHRNNFKILHTATIDRVPAINWERFGPTVTRMLSTQVD